MSRTSILLLALAGFTSFACAAPAADGDTPSANESDVTSAAADPCKGLTLEALAADARTFMLKEKLAVATDEQDFPALGMSMKWKPVALVTAKEAKDKCLVAMNVVTTTDDGDDDESSTNEVIAVARTPQGLVFSKFEDAVRVPPSLRAIIGEPSIDKKGWDDSDFYAEFRGDSAVAIMKDVLTKRAYYGFSGVAVKGKKLDYDKTPGRNWQITNAEFSIRRGMTAEVLDMYAKQLDGDFDGYFSGGMHTETPLGTGVNVAPWNCAVKEILP